MGKVMVSILVSNNKDLVRAEESIIPDREIRMIALDNALVDAGATTLCLPKKHIEKLGLEIDVIKHELRILPDHSKGTYLLAY